MPKILEVENEIVTHRIEAPRVHDVSAILQEKKDRFPKAMQKRRERAII